MSQHCATIRWTRESADFAYESYNRAHRWEFEAGIEVAASAAPDFRGDPDRVDPEEAFVASLSSCHMLTFLAICARKRLVVDRYTDRAAGFLEKNAQGKLAVTKVVLRPEIAFGGDSPPSKDEIERLHRLTHEQCFIANSVLTQVTVEPRSAMLVP